MEQNTTTAVPHTSPDLALHASHEHTHQHLHHDARAEKGRTEEVVYSTGTTAEKSVIPDQDPLDNVMHRRQHAGEHSPEHGVFEKETGIAYNDKSYDAEKGEITLSGEEKDPKSHKFSRFYAKYRIFFHLFFLLLFTGWWIAGLVLHRNDKNWIIPFLLWLAITLRIITFHVPITLVTKPMHFIWNNTAVRIQHLIPEKLRVPAGAALVIAVIIVGAMASPEAADNTRANRAISLFGLVVFIFSLWATSRDRKRIVWHTVSNLSTCSHLTLVLT
jgi:CNT family concentrative nucleoside transporter